MDEIDRYLAELSDLYSYDSFFRVSVESVIDRMLEIRSNMPKSREIIIDGDELSKYFRGGSSEK
jgi:hypothetical protein